MVALDQLPEYTAEQVLEHADSSDLWCIIDGVVYDLTKFAAEHPGGEEVLVEQAGKDATESFNDIGHSSDAKEMAKEYAIGRVKGGAPCPKQAPAKAPVIPQKGGASLKEIMTSPTWTNFIIPTVVGCLVYILYKGVQRIL